MKKTPLIIDFMEKLIEKRLPTNYWNGKSRVDVCELTKYILEEELKAKSDKAIMDKSLFSVLKTKYKLRFPITKFFNNNYYELINDVYPDRFKPWQLLRTAWTNANICSAMQWLVEVKCEGRTQLTKEDFMDNGLDTLYGKFNGNIDGIYLRAFKTRPVKETIEAVEKVDAVDVVVERERRYSRVRNLSCVLSNDDNTAYIVNNIQTGAYDIIKENTQLYLRNLLFEYAGKTVDIKGSTNKQDLCRIISRVIKIAHSYDLDIEIMLAVVCLHEMGYLYDTSKYNEYSRKEFINNRVLYGALPKEKADIVAQSLLECRFSPSIKQTTPYSKLLIDFKKKANLEGMVINLILMAKQRNRKGKQEFEFVEKILRNTFIHSHYGRVNYKLSEPYVQDDILNTMKTVNNSSSIKAIYDNVKIKYGI